jgi:predicted RND superfamily exporter protein
MKNKKQRRNRIRLGVDYALLMINKYCEKKKTNAKTYSRKKKHRKAGTDIE